MRLLSAAVLACFLQTAALTADVTLAEAEAQTRLQPSSANNWQRLGLARYLQNQIDKAIPAFEQALKLDPKLWPSHLFLGASRYRLNQFREALEALRQADRLAPPVGQGRDDLDYWLGASLIAARNPIEGLAALERLLARSPQHVAALQLATETYAEASVSLWNAIAEQAFDSSAGQEVHGYALENQGNRKGALQAFEEAARLAPGRPGPGTAIARLKLREGDLAGARQAIERELKLEPSSADANLFAGLLAVAENSPLEAASRLRKASTWLPGNEEPLLALVQVYLSSQQFTEALAVARRAVALDPNSAASHELLVAALAALQDTAGVAAERERWRNRK